MSKQPNGTGKQSTLLGFFTKSQAAPKTPGTPSTITSNGSSSRDRASSSASNVGDASSSAVKPPAAPAFSIARPTATGTKREAPSSRPASSASPSAFSQTIELESSDVEPDVNSPALGATKKSRVSAMKSSKSHLSESEGESSTAPTSEMDLDEEDDDDIGKSKRMRRSSSKRSVILSESDDNDEDVSRPKKKTAVKRGRSATSGSDSADYQEEKADEDDDFDGDDDIDWDAAADISDTPASRPGQKKNASSSKTSKQTKGKQRAAEQSEPEEITLDSVLSHSNTKKSGKSVEQRFKEASRRVGQDPLPEAGGNERETPFEFIRPGKIRDADGKRPGDADYDPRTIKISQGQMDAMSPFEKQFWDIKRKHFDTVLFFQKGKFFELYENDADIGHQEFDLKLTGRVKMRMVGVPEASIDFWIAKFLGKGYKVGRVDQAETAIGADIRRADEKSGKVKAAAKSTSGKTIVQRALKSVLTTGTIVDGALLTDDLSNHVIAIKEFIPDSSCNPRFGIVVADCSTAEFSIAAFEDDACRTKLETSIRQHRPKELICEKGNLSVSTTRLLRSCVGEACQWNTLKAGTEFLTAADAKSGIRKLFQGEKEDDEMDGLDDEEDSVPEPIRQMYGNEEAMSALGGIMWYFKGLNLDQDLFKVRNFNIFDPIQHGETLILDGQTLAHIEVLQNSSGTDEGTLYKLLCRCKTPFGNRLFKTWLCQPLRSADMINARLDAVEDLMNDSVFPKTFKLRARKMPDLERLLSRIHARNCRTEDFLKVLEAFDSMEQLFEQLTSAAEDFKSSVIPDLLRTAPDLKASLERIQGMFVQEGGQGKGDGGKDTPIELIPLEGADEDYDALNANVIEIEDELNEELQKYRRELGLKSNEICFRDMGTKDIFQVQVPAKTKVPKDWTKMSSTKDVNRYWSPKVEQLVKDVKEARERKAMAIVQFQFKILEDFSQDYALWKRAVSLVAELDCLLSLADSSSAIGLPAVRPEIVDAPEAFADFQELRHPCVFSADRDFIPNDVQLGGDQSKMVLLTGPNMAGKSTLLRMSCVGIIMAQLGCYVPATSARISPCDRIVSRMGASDNMLAGQSTFMVEMEDCRKILVEATPKTLVILDELGRGTSTFDGLSIAYAVLHQLAGHLGCIGFFATHFTSLVEDFGHHPQIALKHMQTHVDDDTKEVTFLYRLTGGSSPKSYGPHVASMAGVPKSVVDRAIQVSKEFEDRTKAHEARKKQNQALPLDLQADAAYLLKLMKRNILTDTKTPRLIREKIAAAAAAKKS